MLMRDAGQRFGQRRGAVDIPGDDLEHRAVHEPECRGGEVSQNRYSPGCRVDKLSRAIDLAERPKHDRQIDHGGNADILAEAKGEIAVSFGIENRQGLFEVRAPLDEISGKPLRHAIDPMCDARFRRMGLLLDVAQKSLRGLAHRGQIAVHMGGRPEPVIDRIRALASLRRPLPIRCAFRKAAAVSGAPWPCAAIIAFP